MLLHTGWVDELIKVGSLALTTIFLPALFCQMAAVQTN
jgi:hypothetical protein